MNENWRLFTDNEKAVLFRLSRRLVIRITLYQRRFVIESMLKVSSHKQGAVGLNERFNVTISKGGIAKVIAKWNQLSVNEDQYREKCD